MPRPQYINFVDKFSYIISDCLVPILDKYNIHPNIVTSIGFIPIYFVHIYIEQKKRILTFLFAFINYTLDCIDGELARKSGKTSTFGGFLDSLHDSISICSVLYHIFSYYAILYYLLFSGILMMFFKFNPITHTASKNNKYFQIIHDNLNVLYYLIIEIAIRFT